MFGKVWKCMAMFGVHLVFHGSLFHRPRFSTVPSFIGHPGFPRFPLSSSTGHFRGPFAENPVFHGSLFHLAPDMSAIPLPGPSFSEVVLVLRASDFRRAPGLSPGIGFPRFPLSSATPGAHSSFFAVYLGFPCFLWFVGYLGATNANINNNSDNNNDNNDRRLKQLEK